MLHSPTAIIVASEATSAGVPPWILGAATFVILMLALGVAYAFRSLGSKH